MEYLHAYGFLNVPQICLDPLRYGTNLIYLIMTCYTTTSDYTESLLPDELVTHSIFDAIDNQCNNLLKPLVKAHAGFEFDVEYLSFCHLF